MSDHPRFEPEGLRFWSQARQQLMILVEEGPWKDWFAYRHPDGNWVSLRRATHEELEELRICQGKPPRLYVEFRMVLDDSVLVQGRRILWQGSNGQLIPGTIIKLIPGIAFLVRDDDGHEGEIYIERIKFFEPPGGFG